MKLIGKDDLQLPGKREFFKSYSFWEKNDGGTEE
jgi:hypothetical protein